MCPQVGSEKLESILIGDNDRPMLEIATVGAQGGSEGALIRSTVGRLLIGWHPSCLCGGFCALCLMLYATGPSIPVQGHSGAAGRPC